jgi:RanGTP-binding protein
MRLESKIKIISPAIDMIELIAARGNTSLDSAVTLTKSIRYEIQSLGMRLSKAIESEAVTNGSRAQRESGLRRIIGDIKRLLTQIEDSVPLISLAITTSGVNLSTALPPTVSPSRLLQASTFLSAGDSQYASSPNGAVQVGSVFVLSLYMLFGGHSLRGHDDGIRGATWKEVIHKARVKLMRVPLAGLFELPSSGDRAESTCSSHTQTSEDFFKQSIPSDAAAHEFGYQLLIVEDLDDGRVHTTDDGEAQPSPFDDVAQAGIREVIPIHEVSKIFYADTGKILNIGADGEPNNPILLLKRDPNAVPPRRMVEANSAGTYFDDLPSSPTRGSTDAEASPDSPPPKSNPGTDNKTWRFPANLDPEWFAFEVFTEDPETDEDDELDEVGSSPLKQASETASVKSVTGTFSSLRLDSSPVSNRKPTSNRARKEPLASIPSPTLPVTALPRHAVALPALRTSLSLLELLIRLTALQQFQQCSHLAINDELLNFFLAESSSTGAGLDSDRRRMLRANASARIGFDPYAESPIKIRGEDDVYSHDRQPSDDLPNYDPRRQPQGFSSPVNYAPTPDDLAVSNRRGEQSWRERETYAASPSPAARQEWPPRIAALRAERMGRKGRLERSESDSTLGTSPMSATGARGSAK